MIEVTYVEVRQAEENKKAQISISMERACVVEGEWDFEVLVVVVMAYWSRLNLSRFPNPQSLLLVWLHFMQSSPCNKRPTLVPKAPARAEGPTMEGVARVQRGIKDAVRFC